MLFGTSLGNLFLLNVIWDYSGATISKNENMDHSGEAIFKNQYLGVPDWDHSGDIIFKNQNLGPFEDQFSATLSYPSTSCKTKFGAIPRYEVLAPGTSVLPPPGLPP